MKRYGLVVLLLAVAVASTSMAAAFDNPSGLWGESVLYRDEWGVPHVYAENPRAMAFAFGYAQAEDHLEKMLLAYRQANGRLAEVVGEHAAESDRLAIQLAHAELARDAYALADSITSDLCEGFALGVNTWIMEHPDDVPPWAEGIRPADVLALFHRFMLSQAPFDYPDAYHMKPAMPSANAWAVAPAMSRDGQALLVMNPHERYDDYLQWYEAHLATRDLDVYGATLFGLPVILQGHNERLGWALSPNQPDIADVYIEIPPASPRGNPKSMMENLRNPRRYGIRYTVETQRPLYIWSEQGFSQDSIPQLRTGRGPVVARAEGRNLSWRVGGYDDFGGIRQLYDMGRAQDIDAFRRVIDRQQLSSFHVVYADDQGNIFYQYGATTGRRTDPRFAAGATVFANAGDDPASVYDAPLTTADAYFNWGETLTPDVLPWLLNPRSGYVQACETPPWLATSPSGTGPDAWPAWLVNDTDSYRAKRVRLLLSQGTRSFEDMQAMLFDTVVPLAAKAVPFLLAAAEADPGFVSGAHPDVLVALDMLSEWNYLAEPGSFAMTFFHVWWSIFRLDDYGYALDSEIVHRRIQENEPWFQRHALDSAGRAAQLMRNEFQTMNVPWGEVHVLERGNRRAGIGGALSGEPLLYTGDRLYDRGVWRVDQGYGFAMVVAFGDAPRAVSLTPFGTSESPESPHYDDQLDLLLDRRFKLTRFARADVERHAASAIGTQVLLRPRRQQGTVLLRSERPLRGHVLESETPPAELPAGLAAFTRYVEPIVEGLQGPVLTEIELYIPQPVCRWEDFERLYVYVYHPVLGWRRVEEQAVDLDRRTLLARYDDAGVFAVLGPEDARLAAPEALPEEDGVLVARAEDAATERGATAEVNARPRPLAGGTEHRPTVTRVAHNEDAGITRLSPEDEERVAQLFPPRLPSAPPTIETPIESYVEPPHIRSSGNLRAIKPALPPGFDPARDLVPLFSPNTVGGEQRFTPMDAQPARTWQSRESVVPDFADDTGDTEALVDATPESERVRGGMPATPESASGNEPIQDSTPPATSTPEDGPKLVWSDQSPAEMRERRGARRGSLELAPNPGRASDLQYGAQMELRTPDGGGLFVVRTGRTVRAQAYWTDAPRAPYPPGLMPYTPVYEVVVDPGKVSGNTALTIQAIPGAVDPRNFDRMRLYVLDAREGWIPLPGQKSDPDALTFSGIDFGMRSYVVLGPPAEDIRR